MNEKVVRKAAEIAAPVFKREGWMWTTSRTRTRVDGVPDASEIAALLRRLVGQVERGDSEFVSSGRLAVQGGDGGIELFLSIGWWIEDE